MNTNALSRRKSERGVAAYLFIATALMVAVVGLNTAQIGLISSERANLQNAADAAALAAVATETPSEDMEQVARRTFLANISPRHAANLKQFAVTTTLGDQRTAVVNFGVQFDGVSPGITGKAAPVITGSAHARGPLQRNVDVDLWLDSSASMGVAADEAGRDRLRQISANDAQHRRCAFACHMPTRMSTNDDRVYGTSMARAHAHGVKLRVDLMKEAVEIMLDELAAATDPDVFIPRVSAAALSTTWQRQLDLTLDMEAARRYIRGFTLSADARFTHASSASQLSLTFATGRDRIGIPTRARTGSRSNPEKYVIIVTDGMQFNWNSIRHGPVDTLVCTQIKQRVNGLIVVHTPYVRLDGDGAFNQWVRPVYHQLAPALQACATPGLYFEASHPEQLKEAFHKIAKTLAGMPALTQ